MSNEFAIRKERRMLDFLTSVINTKDPQALLKRFCIRRCL